MDPEPPATSPGDTTPPAEPSAPAGQPEPAAEAPAPYAAYGPPPAPPARPARSARPLIAIVLAVIIVIVAVIGYAVAGYAYSQSRLSTARDAYNSVVDSENKLTDAVNGLGTKITGSNVTSASSTDLKSDQTLVAQLISQSQDAQTQIATDEATLAKADSDLQQNQWLTVISKGDIDKMTTRIGHLSKALSDAKTITADYAQIGAFYQAFLAMAVDFDTLGNSTSSSDLTAVAATIQTLKTDVAKAVSLDKAPGLPPEMDAFLKDLQVVSTDLANVINTAASGDSAAFDAAVSAANADTAKLDAFDFNKMSSDIEAFYKPMIDDYNSEIDKANAK
jgi:hypothetical protein